MRVILGAILFFGMAASPAFAQGPFIADLMTIQNPAVGKGGFILSALLPVDSFSCVLRILWQVPARDRGFDLDPHVEHLVSEGVAPARADNKLEVLKAPSGIRWRGSEVVLYGAGGGICRFKVWFRNILLEQLYGQKITKITVMVKTETLKGGVGEIMFDLNIADMVEIDRPREEPQKEIPSDNAART